MPLVLHIGTRDYIFAHKLTPSPPLPAAPASAGWPCKGVQGGAGRRRGYDNAGRAGERPSVPAAPALQGPCLAVAIIGTIQWRSLAAASSPGLARPRPRVPAPGAPRAATLALHCAEGTPGRRRRRGDDADATADANDAVGPRSPADSFIRAIYLHEHAAHGPRHTHESATSSR